MKAILLCDCGTELDVAKSQIFEFSPDGTFSCGRCFFRKVELYMKRKKEAV